MASEPVTVWVAADASGTQWISRDRPCWIGQVLEYDIHQPFDMFSAAFGINVPPSNCVEYVMLPADQYREMQRPQPADLSPVERVKLIAKLAVNLSSQGYYSTVADACADAEKFIAAAREIESGVK